MLLLWDASPYGRYLHHGDWTTTIGLGAALCTAAETPMTAVVVTHAVGNIDTWLKGGADRKGIFPNFCSSHRIFRHPDQANRISIVCENVDLAKLKATMDSAEAKALIAKHTVIEPIEFYVEVDGGS